MKVPRVFSYLLFFLLLELYYVGWRASQKQLSDFPVFYSSARVWNAGGNAYDRKAQCAVQVNVRPDLCMPYTHPPLLLPLFGLLVTDDYFESYNRWTVVLLFVLGLCAAVAYQLSKDLAASLQAIVFYPVMLSVTQGQVSPIILLSVLLFASLLVTNRDLWAGLALSLSVLKPQIALLLALPLLFTRRKAFLGFCIGGILLFGYSFALVGMSGFRTLLEIIATMMRGQEVAADPARMYSVTGLLSRAGITRLWAWPIFGLAIVLTSFLWHKYKVSLHALSFAVVIATFASPHLYVHDLSLLAIPAFLIHPLAPALISLILLISFATGFKYAGVYCVMVALGIYHIHRMAQNRTHLTTNCPKESSGLRNN